MKEIFTPKPAGHYAQGIVHRGLVLYVGTTAD